MHRPVVTAIVLLGIWLPLAALSAERGPADLVFVQQGTLPILSPARVKAMMTYGLFRTIE